MNETAPVQAGDVLAGKYRVEQVLGVGGMGVVVSARHEQLDERVALKFLLPQCAAHPEIIARFAREGRAAAKIKSEHVARVRDVGTLETGAPYLVMEHLSGQTLSAVLDDRGPMAVHDAVDYVLQACEALAEAHALGIVHRDLKPSNLFVTRRADGSECVKVLDFGISKVTTTEGTASDITRTAASLGSPLYMSPEQMTAPKTVDARSDIWALGVVLFELLTRNHPFQGESLPQLCIVIVTSAPVLPRALRPDLPASLEAVILKCLEKDPDTRFANVGELVRALAPFAPPRSSVSIDRILRIAPATVKYDEPPTKTVLALPITPSPSASTIAPYVQTGSGSQPGVVALPPRTSIGTIVGIASAVIAVAGVLAGIGTCYVGRGPAKEHAPAAAVVASPPPSASVIVEEPLPVASVATLTSATPPVAPPVVVTAPRPLPHQPAVAATPSTVAAPPSAPPIAKPPPPPASSPAPAPTPKANPFDLRK